MLDLSGDSMALAGIGLAGGLVLGFAARVGRFCTLGAIEDFHYGGSTTRARMWAVALGVAILTLVAAEAAGLFDPASAIYLSLPPSYPAAALGGLIFGLGMALAGNCGYGALARLGGGALRSFVIVVVMGLSAMAMVSGPFGPLRAAFQEATTFGGPARLTDGLALATGITPAIFALIAGTALLALGIWRADGLRVMWGVPVGLAVASGFVGSDLISQAALMDAPSVSHSFAVPLGDTLLYVMLATGIQPSFGIGSVLGVVLGAFAGSRWQGRFRWEACDDGRELRRQIGGAALMGAGAVLAFGCSVGQGLSAASVMAATAPVTMAGIWLGAVLGLRLLIEGRIASI
ncbi:YeeE/YedE family protein [Paracoccus sp. TK19116]|uniref:YeeE/YedE family protein n=1 Tax=Paracoccus albicereus TaxID=2922394 RepID=A0ABT1MUW9_9RHOB|nr:YeeE/YedE family protein [Paracoccus albicereus]MCQ0972133.1 YeeE/YedE family protein [Paracoccus albicereus]